MRILTAFLLFLATALPAPAAEVTRGVVFTIRIPAVLRVKMVETPQRLQVTREDLARGRIDLDEATVVSVQNNCRGGITVSTGLVAGDVERVEFLLAKDEPAADSAHLRFWGTEPRVLRIGYRLYLKPGAVAGDRDWPVALRFANCA